MRPRTAEEPGATAAPQPSPLSDEQVVERVLAGDTALFEIIMRRYNQRLFRTIRAMTRDDSEAEDILQEAWFRAFSHLRQFEGRALFSTWLTRIAMHEAMARHRKGRRLTSLDDRENLPELSDELHDGDSTPEEAASSTELRGVLEEAIRRMPESLRIVFVLREVDGLDTDETADCLGISPGSVKVRLHRARSVLRAGIDRRLGEDVRKLYQFAGKRCDDIVASVMSRIRGQIPP